MKPARVHTQMTNWAEGSQVSSPAECVRGTLLELGRNGETGGSLLHSTFNLVFDWLPYVVQHQIRIAKVREIIEEKRKKALNEN